MKSDKILFRSRELKSKSFVAFYFYLNSSWFLKIVDYWFSATFKIYIFSYIVKTLSKVYTEYFKSEPCNEGLLLYFDVELMKASMF